MDTNRVLNIILTDMTLANLKAQEELERIINSDIELTNKLKHVSDLLETISLNELKIAKFQGMITTKNNENQDKK